MLPFSALRACIAAIKTLYLLYFNSLVFFVLVLFLAFIFFSFLFSHYSSFLSFLFHLRPILLTFSKPHQYSYITSYFLFLPSLPFLQFYFHVFSFVFLYFNLIYTSSHAIIILLYDFSILYF